MSGHDHTEAVVVAARRTPIGTGGRTLANVSVDRLAAATIGAVLADTGAVGITTPVDDVVLGNCMGPGGNVARVAALAAGLDVTTPGGTVDRQCGSGLAAVLQGTQAVRGDGLRLVLAGGAESPSTAPLRSLAPVGADTPAVPYDRAPFAPPDFEDPDMGQAADALARARGVSRERQDVYAVASHDKTLNARAGGRFDAELVPVAGLTQDERPRRLTVERLSRLRAAFVPGGTVTAGNSCPVSDGAALVAVVPEALRRRAGAPGLRLVRGAVVGCDPGLPGWGPVPAVEKVLTDAGVRLDEVRAVEIVEAFASQVLAVTDALGLDPLGRDQSRVCGDGGALALGHPWGASGAVSVVRLFSRLVRADAPAGTLGLATAAVGGGMGIAALFEVVR